MTSLRPKIEKDYRLKTRTEELKLSGSIRARLLYL